MPRPRLDNPRRAYSLRLSAEERHLLAQLAAHLDMTESATIRLALDSLAESVRIADEILEKQETE